jgi:hypothetical protein
MKSLEIPAELQERICANLEQQPGDEQPILGTITPEKRREGGAKGRRAQAESSNEMRLLWWTEAVRILEEAYDHYRWLTRAELIDGLRSFNLQHRLAGKGGGQVKRSTISKWLTVGNENAIRFEAVEKIVIRRVAAQR